jgi:hypothetical protein
LLSRWKSEAPPEALNGKYPSSSRMTRSEWASRAAISVRLMVAVGKASLLSRSFARFVGQGS